MHYRLFIRIERLALVGTFSAAYCADLRLLPE